jgi:light-regulated signal transduction histidine kinase (bacteriophytochrome)
LRHIGGFSNLLLKENYDGLDAKGRERLDRIIAASTRMGTLIDDLLNLSRIARQPLSVKAVDLSAMAGEISDALVRENPQRSVEIDIAPGLTIQADHGLMRIVMTNLIENAWKYSANSAHARIEIGATSRDGETVYYVRDNGAGFDMKYSDKLFSPFQRLHSEAEFAGTGVGLATVKRIIERHQGKVWIEGAVDHGATVYFSIGNPDIVQAGTLKGPGD